MVRLVTMFLTLCVFSRETLAETGDDVNALLTNIYTTRGYNKKIRPITDQTHALEVSLDFVLNSVIDFDEKTGSLKTAGSLLVEWTDEYFTWTPASFNNTEEVFVPQDDVWKPDIALSNSFKSFAGLGSSYLNLLVDNNGYVTWTPYQVLESTCGVSITYFPFDEQICDLKFTAWSYTKYQVEINMGRKGVLLDDYTPNASWELSATGAEEINTDEAAVVFSIKLKRKPRFYIINIVIPVIFLSILNVFSFVLPVVSGERAGYSITVFLSLAVFLTIVSDQLPNNSENTSFMAVYLMLITGLSTAIVILCVFQLRLLSWNDTQRPVTKFYSNFVAIRNCFRCRKSKKQSVAPKDGIVSTTYLKDVNRKKPSSTGSDENDKKQSVITWLDVVDSMDSIFFVVSIVFTFTCTLAIGIMSVHATQ